MFAPALLCTSLVPQLSSIPAAIAAVVVLPLVAEITALPALRRAESSEIASGRSLLSTMPGTLVAPPPRSRESAPAVRAAAIAGGRGRLLN